LSALVVGLAATVMTYFALGAVVGMALDLVMGFAQPVWLLHQGAAPRWFVTVPLVLGAVALLPSAYVGWRIARGVLRSEPKPLDPKRFMLATQGALWGAVMVYLVAVFGFQAPVESTAVVILGPMFVGMFVFAGVAGMRARPTDTTGRDWLRLAAVLGAILGGLTLFAVGILSGHVALVIVLAPILIVVLMVGWTLASALRTRRAARRPQPIILPAEVPRDLGEDGPDVGRLGV
jgi:hypothetical protein